MAALGYDVDKIWRDIDDLVVKTLISGQQGLWDLYKIWKSEDVENQHCFQILGFDVMLDSNLKPWLIEVNHAPSLSTDSAFDHQIKSNLVLETI